MKTKRSIQVCGGQELDMPEMMNQGNIQGISFEIARFVLRSAYEFGKALATVIFGGLFLFYSYVCAVGVLQFTKSGEPFKSVFLASMLVVCLTVSVHIVAFINGVTEH